MPQYTRANTAPGSPERKQVYAREYAARTRKSGQETGLSYTKQRQLRELYPVTAITERNLHRKYGASPGDIAVQKTKYALYRAHIARAYKAQGKSLSLSEQKAVRTIKGMPHMPGNPVQHLAAWYSAIDMPFMPGPRYAVPDMPWREQSDEGSGLGAPGERAPWQSWLEEDIETGTEELDLVDFADYDLGEYSG